MSEQNTKVAVGSCEDYVKSAEPLREAVKDYLASVALEQEVAARLAKVIAGGLYVERDIDEWGYLVQDHKECASEVEWSRKGLLWEIVQLARITRWAPDALTKAYEFGIHDPNLMDDAATACRKAFAEDEAREEHLVIMRETITQLYAAAGKAISLDSENFLPYVGRE